MLCSLRASVSERFKTSNRFLQSIVGFRVFEMKRCECQIKIEIF